VYLDNHGPNVVINHNIDPDEVIKFIEENFDLAQKLAGQLVKICCHLKDFLCQESMVNLQ
jgi:hypothetical protein